MPDWLFRWEDQWGAPLRYLVTQGRHVDPCANTRDGATARLGPGQRSRRRGSSFGSQAWRASGLGWRSCWPLCRHGPSNNTGVGGYAGRDEITSDSTCIYGGLHRPSRPLLRGRIISQRDPCPVWVFGMSRHVASPSRGVQSTVRNRRVDRKFKPRVLRQIQTGADRQGPAVQIDPAKPRQTMGLLPTRPTFCTTDF